MFSVSRTYAIFGMLLLFATVKGTQDCEYKKEFNLAVAIGSTSKGNKDPGAIVNETLTNLWKRCSKLKPENISVSIIDSNNATIAIQFDQYHDKESLMKEIAKLDLPAANAKDIDLGPLLQLSYSKQPDVMVVIMSRGEDIKYIIPQHPGKMFFVPKVWVELEAGWGKWHLWSNAVCIIDFPTKEAKPIAVSVCKLAARIDPHSVSNEKGSLASCVLPSSILDSSPTAAFSRATTTHSEMTIFGATPSLETTVSSTSYITSASSLPSQTHSINITATSYTSFTASTKSVGAHVNEHELLRRDYHRVMGYESAAIDLTNSSLLKDFVDSASRLLRTSVKLKEIASSEKNATLLNVLGGLEKYCLRVSKVMANDSSGNTNNIRIGSDNVDVAIYSTPVTIFEGFDYGSLDIDAAYVHVPKDAFQEDVRQEYLTIVAMIIKPFKSFQEGHLLDKSQNVTLASNIITVTMVPPPAKPLKHPLKIQVNRNTIFGWNDTLETSCVFWETTRNGWSTKGCHLTYNNATITECQCNHMTHFAVLMSLSDQPVPKVHRNALTIISYIGCTLSIIGVFLTIVTFLILPVLRSERTRIHFNLSVAVGVSQILFLAAGTEALVNSKPACKFYAALMFYWFTSVFTWMLVEGVHLYQMVIIAFVNRAMMKFYYVIGWGLPLCIVVISSSIAHKGYGTPEFCWLSLNHNTIWAFTGPAMSIVVVNFVVLVAVLRLRSKLENSSSVRSQVKTGARVSIVLLPLLGLTWIFGLFTALDDSIAFQYIFAITNSLQGVMIFAFHCVGNSEVRKEFQRKASHWQLMRNLSSISHGMVSMVTPVNKIDPTTQEMKTFVGGESRGH